MKEQKNLKLVRNRIITTMLFASHHKPKHAYPAVMRDLARLLEILNFMVDGSISRELIKNETDDIKALRDLLRDLE